MPHGQPDYGMYGKSETIYKIADMGELAARLGSINTYDRRGDVVYLSSFEEGLIGWYPGGVGTGYSVTQSTDYARNGMCSCKMVCGSTSTLNANIQRRLPYPTLSNLGVEFSFNIYPAISSFILGVYLYDGSEYNVGAIKYDQDNDDLYYEDSNGNWVLLDATAQIGAIVYLFHTIKLVIDYENNKYKRLLVNHNTYDLSDIAVYATADSTEPCIIVRIDAYGLSGSSVAILYIDDVIVTQNEP